MSGRTRKGAVAATAVAALVACGSVALLPPTAYAASPVLPGNEADVGVYTDGLADSLDIGDPVYRNLDAVDAALDPGVPFTADSMYQ